ncbi:MAG: carbohydrate ABC transporter permease [Spirochaetaceae bacterium]|jgi:putative aldouronate transport system permease protein|nr:carbohydrate ABC transporter permease [Spirochaetaceae bacterium]
MKKMTASDYGIYGCIGVISLLFVLPFIYVLSVSFTDPKSYMPFTFYLIPKQWSLESYRYILSTHSFLNSFKSTLYITVVGTFLNLVFTLTFAYGITKTRVPGFKLFHTMVIVTLFFSAGTIPTFLVVKNLHLLNTRWALILSALTSAWDIVVVRSFFLSIPATMEESARIDGCNDLDIFFRIILPLSMPVIATFTLFFTVRHWNTYFNALIYISDTSKWTLQLMVKQLVIDSDASGIGQAMGGDAAPPQETVRMASVVLSMLPIMCVYPFLQKHFAKGVMIGSIKG